MAGESTTPNMGLILPGVGLTASPTWATDLNTSLTTIDGHNHSAGSGAQISPAGMNINTDLPMNGNNLTLIRSARYQPQVAPLSTGVDLGCCYVSGVDLYYNDVNGNQVRITSGGAVVGSSAGSITNLTAPASATYVSGTLTFVWQSSANTSANMDFGSAIFRNNTLSSFGVTVQPPSLSSNYTLTLPTVPAAASLVSIDTSGNLGSWALDNSTLTQSANIVAVKPQGITQGLLALRASGSTVAAGGVAMSASCGIFTSTSASYVAVTNLSVTITTTGRPVEVRLVPFDAASNASIGIAATSSSSVVAFVAIYRAGSIVSQNRIRNNITPAPTALTVEFPPSSVSLIDPVAAGTYTYTVEVMAQSPATVSVTDSKLIAYET